MNRRFIDWIWHIRGSLALGPGQSSDEAFGKLASLFSQPGSSHRRMNDTMTFCKKDQAAQDKMSIFDSGVLRIEESVAGPVLRYHLTSRALLFCFLAPLLFLGFAGLTVGVGKLEKPGTEAVSKKPKKKNAELLQHPIDKALGAPAPEKPKKDGADKSKEEDQKPSPIAAYIFAAIFAVLFVVGRILEGKLVNSLFRKRLLGL